MSRIFISYKRVDKERVFNIKDQIESALGEECWIDLDGIESDAQFANVIINAINSCEVFLFMYSSAHSKIDDYKNDWTIRELDFAQHKKKRIVFVNIDTTLLSDWFYMLFGTMQQVDATKQDSIEKLIQDMSRWLESVPKSVTTIKTPFIGNGEALKYKTFRLGRETIKLVRVKKGTFIMGSIVDNEGLSVSDYSCPHEVVITRDYYISVVPVTQELWYYLMENQPSRFNYSSNAPVDSVSWNDCIEFIRKLNFATGVEFRLPTEAEWEYAARGGLLSKNYIYSGSNNIDDVAWHRENSGGMTHDVAIKQPNELGIFDMSGNVWEWCSDVYSDLEQTSVKDPKGPSIGKHHVYRGGCWCEVADCSVVSRRPGLSDYRSCGGLGLRLAMSV